MFICLYTLHCKEICEVCVQGVNSIQMYICILNTYSCIHLFTVYVYFPHPALQTSELPRTTYVRCLRRRFQHHPQSFAVATQCSSRSWQQAAEVLHYWDEAQTILTISRWVSSVYFAGKWKRRFEKVSAPLKQLAGGNSLHKHLYEINQVANRVSH